MITGVLLAAYLAIDTRCAQALGDTRAEQQVIEA
jgi:hypothetical protein